MPRPSRSFAAFSNGNRGQRQRQRRSGAIRDIKRREENAAVSPEAETAVRVGIAATLFAALALCEWRAPRRRLNVGRRGRWFGNIGIVAFSHVLIRLVMP